MIPAKQTTRRRSQDQDFWSSVFEEVRHIRFWVLLVFGLGLLFASTIIDIHIMEKAIEAGGHNASIWYEKSEFISSMLREIGFASLIALLIAVFVEHESRKRQEIATDSMIENLSKGVFEAVLGRRLPYKLINEVFSCVLDSAVIRDNFRCNLNFSEIEKSDGSIVRDYIMIQVSNVYSIRNISRRPAKDIAIRVGFPKSPTPEFEGIVKLEEVSIGKPLSPSEINDGYNNIEDTGDMKRYRWYRDIDTEKPLDIRISYTMIKERSANEVWRSLLPTLGMQFDITMNCDGLRFDAHALHREELEKINGHGSTGFHSWNLPGAMLPHQGVVVWWRPERPALLAPPLPPQPDGKDMAVKEGKPHNSPA